MADVPDWVKGAPDAISAGQAMRVWNLLHMRSSERDEKILEPDEVEAENMLTEQMLRYEMERAKRGLP